VFAPNRCFVLLASLIIAACGSGDSPPPVSEPATDSAQEGATSVEDIRAIARDAYVFGFPLAVGYKTLYNYVVDTDNPEYKGPFNEVSCEARLFTPDDKAVVTPNSDTPYCMFWLDLRAEPMVLSVPAIEPERFYHFQLVDLYTHNYAYVGTLTTGNTPGKFLLSGPDWTEAAPDGVDRVIQSETNLVFVVVRTQLFDPEDLPRVEEIQRSYDVQPLSAFAQTPAPEAAAELTFPTWVEGAQFDERSFEYIDFVLQLLGAPSGEEAALRERMATIGIDGEGDFELASVSDSTRDALAAGVQDGFAEIEQFARENGNDPLASAKIFGTREFLEDSARKNYGLDNPYLPRAVAAHMGLYGNSAAEAVYPTYLADAEGNALDASKSGYTLTFEDGNLPPAKAFWSLTMYDGKTQLFVSNPLERYLLNSTTMEDYVLEDDGSLVLHISTESPGDALEANWLPAPDGPFYLVLRLYGPEPDVLDGAWTPPGLVPTQE
jgi:hypothetical protein